MAECKKCSDWAQWKEAIQAEIASLTRRGVFTSLVVQNHLSMQLMDVVIAYLYGSLDLDIYMKVSDGIQIPNQTQIATCIV